ncbi:septum formation protein Maf [Sphingorhabdus lutea]|uniref:dTTP/UTP pyrophosphatase n=1 Tax=Sphingorhabdus lutea TaxID=1913578 RepID=A0A1L3JDG5_9SPHN|nr:nucleoside triphosphate pyrophosphatase [Sphingorhabdus lutea]APG63165.1 septum formation protein Maf [Sphingorhabdus lutea]
MQLILASSSPRRRDLLARIGVIPDIIQSPNIDETPLKGELPRDYVLRMVQQKAAAVTRPPSHIVLAGDTSVILGRQILPQAQDKETQRIFLQKLSGRRHRVISGVCVIDDKGQARSELCTTIVRFKRLHSDEIEAYVQSEEGLGKAGGYAIQGRAEALINWMSGSHSAVIGLPLFETRKLLRHAGYHVD